MEIKLHECSPGYDWQKEKKVFPESGYGSPGWHCAEHEDGTLWLDNEEYGVRVNFCPFCGFEAKSQIEWLIST